jgi:signal peptidase II
VAFSLGQDYTFVFPMVTLVVAGWIGWMARRLRSVPWAVALGLVLGGALGNLLDRLFREPGPFVGHVVDFFSVFDPHGRVFPVFNVADSALVIGVCLAVILELTGRRRDGTRVVADRRAGSGSDNPATGPDPPTGDTAAAGDTPADAAPAQAPAPADRAAGQVAVADGPADQPDGPADQPAGPPAAARDDRA